MASDVTTVLTNEERFAVEDHRLAFVQVALLTRGCDSWPSQAKWSRKQLHMDSNSVVNVTCQPKGYVSNWKIVWSENLQAFCIAYSTLRCGLMLSAQDLATSYMISYHVERGTAPNTGRRGEMPMQNVQQDSLAGSETRNKKDLKGRKMKLLHVHSCRSALLFIQPYCLATMHGQSFHPLPATCFWVSPFMHTVTHTHAVPCHHYQPEPWGWSDSITSQS